MLESDFDRVPSGASRQSKGGSFDFAEIPQVLSVDDGESGGEEGDDPALDTQNRSLDMLEAAQSQKPGFFYEGIQEKEVINKTDPRLLFPAFSAWSCPPFHIFSWRIENPHLFLLNSGEIQTCGGILEMSAAAPK